MISLSPLASLTVLSRHHFWIRYKRLLTFFGFYISLANKTEVGDNWLNIGISCFYVREALSSLTLSLGARGL